PFSIPSGPPPSPLAVLVWLAALGLVALLVLPLAFGLSYADYWLHQWRQRRIQAKPSSRPTVADALLPFHYSARQWKATGGILLFASALMAFAWRLLPPKRQSLEYFDGVSLAQRCFCRLHCPTRSRPPPENLIRGRRPRYPHGGPVPSVRHPLGGSR